MHLLNAITLDGGHITALIVCSIALILVTLILRFIIKRKKRPIYEVKQSLMSATEVEYYKILNALLGSNYLVYPQINLATVIDKKSPKGYRTELFRNADFGVFDYNFRPLLLIEINDNSHFRRDRAERDERVQEICKNAKLPIVTFWVKDGFDVEFMRRQLKRYLQF